MAADAERDLNRDDLNRNNQGQNNQGQNEQGQPARRWPRILLAGGAIPAMLVLVAAALIWSWRDELPSPLAIHWTGAGQADGFSELGGVLAFVLGFGGFWVLAGLVIALLVRVSALARAAVATGAGTGALVAVMAALMVHVQRGSADAAATSFAGWWITVGLGVGLVVGFASWVLMPRWESPNSEQDGDPGRAMELSRSERVFWSRTVASDKVMLVVLAVTIPATVVPVALTGQWSLVALALALILLLACLGSIRVTVDDHGFLVRGALRWPRIRVALQDVASARVVSVKALRDTGGYGLRLAYRGEAKGAFGFVPRSGDALLIERRDGGRVMAVVEDADTAAGLLNALVARAGDA